MYYATLPIDYPIEHERAGQSLASCTIYGTDSNPPANVADVRGLDGADDFAVGCIFMNASGAVSIYMMDGVGSYSWKTL